MFKTMKDSLTKVRAGRESHALKSLGVALILILVAVLAPYGTVLIADDEKSGRYDDETPFIVSYQADPERISPLGDVSAASKWMLRNMHEGLYQVNPDGTLSEGVASEIRFDREDSYLIADITLNEGIYFHSGDELNAEAVVYSLKRLGGLIEGITEDMITGAGYWPALLEDPEDEEPQERFEILDNYHLTVKLNDEFGILTTMWSLADALLVPPSVSEEEQQVHPVGLGPYAFVDYVEGDRLVLTRFEDYYGEMPEVKNVEFHKYAELSTLPLAFESGEIDLMDLTRETYDIYSPHDLYIYEGLSNDVHGLYFNLRDDSIFNNKDLRLAFQYGIDKEKMNQTLTQGRGAVLYTHMSPVLEKYYNRDVEDLYNYDLDKAKEHLEAAGYGDGLSLTLKIVAEMDLNQDMAVLIKEDMAKVGVDIEIDPIPWATYYEEVYRGFNFELCILNVVGYPDPSRVLSRYCSDASGNLAGIQESEIDRLLETAQRSMDQDGEAVDAYKEIQRILSEEAYSVYLLDPGVQVVLSEDYEGFMNYPFAFQNIAKVRYR